MKIAFAGNPNSGKTTMFNVLTGSSEHVGNWAGVTVGKKERVMKPEFTGFDKEPVIAVDLPGAYSMSPFTPEEGITSGFIREENPDAIINIVDATNLSRSLFFTTQLLEMGIPVVVALNKSDLNDKENTQIDADKLSEKLGCPVIKTVSTVKSNEGLKEVAKKAVEIIGSKQTAPYIQADIDMHDKAAVDAEDRKRYAYTNGIVAEVETRETLSSEETFGDKLDVILTNKVAGILIFAAVIWAVFYISQTTVGTWIADIFCGWIDAFNEWFSGAISGTPDIVQALLADGIVGGVSAVVGFLPLIMVMFFLIALLEDCGYMARVSVVMDPIFKRVGLSGKSIIPIVIGTGCGVPGIMATRTIRDERERRTTAMLTTFMPCGAKAPVIALFAGAFFSGSAWVGTLMYFVGILLIFLGALMIKAVTGYKYRKSFFIMELPKYKVPSIKFAFKAMMERAKAYIIKAATIILVCNCAVQIMASFNWSFQAVDDPSQSILASVASPFAFLFIPLGFATWQLAAAAITGFIAKENVVGTLAVVFAITNFINTDELAIVGGSEAGVAAAMGLTSVTALGYLMFNLYTPPCFAAIGAMNSELKSKGWLACAIALQLCTGYAVAFIVNQVGNLIVAGNLVSGFVPGLIAIAVMAAAVVVIGKRMRSSFESDYELHRTK